MEENIPAAEADQIAAENLPQNAATNCYQHHKNVSRTWQKNHPEKPRQYDRTYYAANHAEILAKRRDAYRAKAHAKRAAQAAALAAANAATQADPLPASNLTEIAAESAEQIPSTSPS